MTPTPIPVVERTVPRRGLARFGELLQRGAAVRARAGASVEEFLCDGLGLDPRYVAERITTVFLDGTVVDRLDRAHLGVDSLLALSAAMPGLVGATLRRSGYYAAMRSAITHRDEGVAAAGGATLVRVKLFNLLIAELGPVLLGRGVVLSRAEAEELLAGGPELPPGDRLELRVRVVE